MKMKHFPIVVVTTAIAIGISACNSDRAYAPPDVVLTDHQVSTDVAVSEGEAMASDLASIDESALLSGGNFSVSTSDDAVAARNGLTPVAEASSANCTYGNGRWSCAPVSSNGLTIVRSYGYYDAAGQPMKLNDNLKTASINYQLAINGTVARDTSFAGVVHRARNITVSGLLGAETTRRWDGAGTSADTNTHHDSRGTRRYAGRSADSLKGVVYPQPRTQGSFPLSGSTVRVVSYTVTLTGKSSEMRSVDRRVVTTYNGTALAKLQSGSVTCTLHLDTHKVDGCSG